MVSLRSPLGAGTETVSPFLRPINALPTGDSFESRLFAGSASVEPTIAYWKLLPFSSLPETSEPTRTTSLLSSEASITCAERSLSSSCAMRDSSIACSFLASSFSEMSPNSRASLIRSATSRRRVTDRCSISCLSFSRPSGVRMTSFCMRRPWKGSGPGQNDGPLQGGPNRRRMVAALSRGHDWLQACDHRALLGDRAGLLERRLDGLSLAEALDVPGVKLAQVARGALRAEVLHRPVEHPAPLL